MVFSTFQFFSFTWVFSPGFFSSAQAHDLLLLSFTPTLPSLPRLSAGPYTPALPSYIPDPLLPSGLHRPRSRPTLRPRRAPGLPSPTARRLDAWLALLLPSAPPPRGFGPSAGSPADVPRSPANAPVRPRPTLPVSV